METVKAPQKKPGSAKKTIQKTPMKRTEIPLRTLESSIEVLHLAGEVAKYGATNALSDITTSISAGRAALEGAASNVLINLDMLDDKHYVDQTRSRVSELRKEALQLEQRIQEIVGSRSRKK